MLQHKPFRANQHRLCAENATGITTTQPSGKQSFAQPEPRARGRPAHALLRARTRHCRFRDRCPPDSCRYRVRDGGVLETPLVRRIATLAALLALTVPALAAPELVE